MPAPLRHAAAKRSAAAARVPRRRSKRSSRGISSPATTPSSLPGPRTTPPATPPEIHRTTPGGSGGGDACRAEFGDQHVERDAIAELTALDRQVCCQQPLVGPCQPIVGEARSQREHSVEVVLLLQ